jgi:hypothetical protein
MTYRQYFILKVVLVVLVVAALVLAMICGAEAETTSKPPYVAVVDVHPDSGLRCRRGPGTEYGGYTLFAPGAKLLVLEKQNGWARVTWPNYPDLTLGWVCADYLK